MKISELPKAHGLSLVELLIMVGGIAALAAGAAAMVASGTIQGAREVRAHQDLNVLNSAVLAYLSSGGDLSEAENGTEVLAKLRSRGTPAQQERIPGLSGSFLDPSVEFITQTEVEAEKESPRLHWNRARNRFDLARSGAPGIVLLKRDSGEDQMPEQETNRATDGRPEEYEDRLTAFNYASNSTWIWDYADAPLTFSPGPSEVASSPRDDALPPPAITQVPVNRLSLKPPQLSLPGGSYPPEDFNLPLALHDQNPAGVAFLFYSLNYGEWQPYRGGSISVPRDTTVKAQATPVQPESYDPSVVVEAVYEALLSRYEMLLPPVIEFTKNYFAHSSDTITVILTNPNTLGVSEIQYQLLPVPGGTGPTSVYQPYGAPFVVNAQDYPKGFGVRAIAKATLPNFLDSRPVSRFATAQTTLFGGHLDLDTSTTIASLGNGSTDAHTHDILKDGGTSISFFAIPDSSQVEIPEAIVDFSQRFQLTIVNGALSPGMNLVIEYELDGASRILDMPVDQYGQSSASDLPVFTLGGVPGSAKLRDARFSMDQDLIYQAAIVPTNTGDVRKNVPGKNGEWRNGALTLQAVSVNADNSPAHSLDPTLSNGSHGAAISGLLWEAVVFWHWSGDSYHEVRNNYKPRDFNSIRLNLK